MKYIKLFEEANQGKYWLVRTDEPYLTIKKICIAFDPLMDDGGIWFFDSYKEMEKRKFQFMGEIIIPQYEIDAFKYNL